MISTIIGTDGEIALPDALRQRYGMLPNQAVRLIETHSGILVVPLLDAPMSEELTRELEEWQELGASSWEMFDFEEVG